MQELSLDVKCHLLAFVESTSEFLSVASGLCTKAEADAATRARTNERYDRAALLSYLRDTRRYRCAWFPLRKWMNDQTYLVRRRSSVCFYLADGDDDGTGLGSPLLFMDWEDRTGWEGWFKSSLWSRLREAALGENVRVFAHVCVLGKLTMGEPPFTHTETVRLQINVSGTFRTIWFIVRKPCAEYDLRVLLPRPS